MAPAPAGVPSPVVSSEDSIVTAGPATAQPATIEPATVEPATVKPATAKPAAAAKAAPIEGTFKIVKVRRADGTIVRVRRPIPASSSEATPTSANDASIAAPVSQSTNTTAPTTATTTTTTTTLQTTAPIVPSTTKAGQDNKSAAKPEVKPEVKSEVAKMTPQSPKSSTKPSPAAGGVAKTAVSPVPKQSPEGTSKQITGGAAKTVASPAPKSSPEETSVYTERQASPTAIQGPVTQTRRYMLSRMGGITAIGRIALGAIYPDFDLTGDDGDDEDGGDMQEGDDPVTDDDDDNDDDDDDEDDEDDEDKDDDKYEDENKAGQNHQQNSSGPEKNGNHSDRLDVYDRPNTSSSAANQQMDKGSAFSFSMSLFLEQLTNKRQVSM
jgi:hypothetical protein